MPSLIEGCMIDYITEKIANEKTGSKPVDHWHFLQNGRIQCDVCPRYCKLNDGQRGMCFVRKREGEQMVLTTYGRSSGFCIDPVEKKPLHHFLPGTPVLSFGTAGCNLACRFCQNWDMSKSRQMDTLAEHASPEKIARVAEKLECSSVAYTYNDPVIFYEYAVDVAQACHEKGIKSIAVTAGYMCAEPRREFYQYMDAANVDLKGFTEDFYKKYCAAELGPVLDTIVYLKEETKLWFEITNLIIPGHNDSDKELHEMTQWVVEHVGPDVPMHFTAFHPDYKMMDVPHTPEETLTRARRIAMENGVRFAYTGNIYDTTGENTYCHQCGTCLIERIWYRLGQWHLTETGNCQSCGSRCPGIFQKNPGHWGPKHIAVKIKTM